MLLTLSVSHFSFFVFILLFPIFLAPTTSTIILVTPKVPKRNDTRSRSQMDWESMFIIDNVGKVERRHICDDQKRPRSANKTRKTSSVQQVKHIKPLNIRRRQNLGNKTPMAYLDFREQLSSLQEMFRTFLLHYLFVDWKEKRQRDC